MDDLAPLLARAAHDLGLDGHTVEDVTEAVLRQFSAVVLEALTARGLLAGPAELECWAQPRSPLS